MHITKEMFDLRHEIAVLTDPSNYINIDGMSRQEFIEVCSLKDREKFVLSNAENLLLYLYAEKVATFRNATNWKPQDESRMAWKRIGYELDIGQDYLKEIRKSREYAIILAEEVVWSGDNGLDFPYNVRKAFGVDYHTANFLTELRLNAGNTERQEQLIAEFQPK